MKWSAVVVVHASGERLDSEKLLARYSSAHATSYRKGEPTAGGQTYRLSGLKIDLGEAVSKETLEQLLLTHFQEYAGLYGDIAAAGGDVSVGIGLMVPSKEPRTVRLAPELLHVLLDRGVTVYVTGYPCMDVVL